MEKPLIDQLREFLQWLKDHALPGFKSQAEDCYDGTDQYNTAAETLAYYATEMKKSVEHNNQECFDRFRSKYLQLFDNVNEKIAKREYADTLDRILDEGYSNEDARKLALDYAWQDPKMRYYLPVKAILKHQDGREVFLVANKRHIPQDNLYVLTTELEYLKTSGLDPWEYVSTRRA